MPVRARWCLGLQFEVNYVMIDWYDTRRNYEEELLFENMVSALEILSTKNAHFYSTMCVLPCGLGMMMVGLQLVEARLSGECLLLGSSG